MLCQSSIIYLRIDSLILNFTWKIQYIWVKTTKTIMQNNKFWGLTILNVWFLYVIKINNNQEYTALDIDVFIKRVELRSRNKYTYSYLIYMINGKRIKRETSSLFHRRCWSNQFSECKEMKHRTYVTYRKINSNWLKHLIVRAESITP